MSQTIQSPFTDYPGSITLPDGLTLPQMAAWELVMEVTRGRYDKAQSWLVALPSLANIVEAWSIEGIPEKPTIENCEFSPYRRYKRFAGWVFSEVCKIYLGEEEYPKVSGSPSLVGLTAADAPTS